MTIHGDLYYEGKEFETRLREKKPGDLSEQLRTALGMPVGPGSHKVPPPWLIAQQRYGPPPSYPNLKIPGLNAPIPDGCAFGYHAGGWGKPPVDETGKPLYGDVFGHQTRDLDDGEDQDIDRTMWGELESESEEESEEEESGDEGEKPSEVAAGVATPGEGLVTPLGITSVPPGVETPDTIELRKKKLDTDTEGGDTPALYQVVPERRVGLTSGMMASTHVYDIAAANPGKRGVGGATSTSGSTSDAGVEVALDPSELELEPEAVAARYERQLREARPRTDEDLSDMLADHVARQKYFVKKGKTPKEIFEDMVSVLQESAPSYTMVKKWARLFQQGRESCEDDPRPGRPVTVVTEENVRKIEKLVLADQRIKLWQIAEELQISKERVGEIIHEHMNMRKIRARWVPKMLTSFNKQWRLQTSKDFLELVGDNIDEICDRIVTVVKPGFVNTIWNLNRSPCNGQKKEKGRRRNSRHERQSYRSDVGSYRAGAVLQDNASVHTARVSRPLKDTGFGN
ncbi:Splicing factor 3B subunit 2 [Eumeta japonica]|uniref:Splicing factor 3B subunit 2 n=1 Tax=Eumeta variegata TaxID=151549 RepID=A0A4C1W7H5_EUMVA|nr:Splicing factor 3B subunit 2 [Eumeta japonica]